MRVKIDAGGREVEIECSDTNVTADTIGDKAIQLWKETEGAVKPSEGPAFGLQAQVSMPPQWPARMTRGEQLPVKAEEQ